MTAILDSGAFVLDVSEWIGGTAPADAELRGRVVVIEAFQMLCPGCVAHGLPLARRIRRAFDPDEVVVLGLHTVFEHHAVMGRDALEVFLAEYRIDFPVAVDRPVPGRSVPATMDRYRFPGTPSTLVVGRDGVLRSTFFGAVDDLEIGALLGRLLAEPRPSEPHPVTAAEAAAAPLPTSSGASAAAVCRIDGSCS
ncbi:TlpA disulfide reductase family protein [Rathayibacter sp. VKM Ac-2801]|uniref:peroxiredoxin family protein n=1 Tax=Rathayibacter sp. VKM Ac-2801 TaxID=2609255 RepID=UPI001ABED5BB|nr:TlpA disulfide reductase family protein [Rathayibacter sp. VKM Ac-2801]